MIIKKYLGKTESEAIEKAKKDLGPGVVVMNTRPIRKKGFLGMFKAGQIEITVALEEEGEKTRPVTPVTPPQKTALEQLAERKSVEVAKVKPGPDDFVDNVPVRSISRPATDIISEKNEQEKNGGRELKEKLESIETLIKKQMETDVVAAPEKEKAEEKEETTESEQMKLTRLLYNMMVDNEVHEKYANQIIEEAEKSNKPNMPVDYFLTNIYQKMILKFGSTATITEATEGPKVVYFVGPTGVGKTTTIAKLASKFVLEQKKKVALLTADTYRIAAAEQLRTYANILEIPCRIIYSPAEIEEAYEQFAGYDYIFVDTAGHSHHNEEQRNNTNVVIHALDGKAQSQVFLVLSATTKYRDLISIADTYKEMTDFYIIFTKLDETDSLGNLLNLRLYTDSALSYVTYGQNVPDDIDRFDPQATVKKILGG